MKLEYAKDLLKKTKQDYSLIAKDFSRTRSSPWPELRFLFDDYLKVGDRVLDLGCGNGRYFPFFEEKKTDYYGADASKQLIDIANKKWPQGRFFLEEALDLSFPNNFFDKVYSIAVLHQIPSKEFRNQFVNEVKRVLKKKGLFIVSVWKFHRNEEMSSLLKYTLFKAIGKSKLDWGDVFISWGDKTERYYHCFSEKKLEGLVRENGFKIVKSGVISDMKKNRENIYLVAERI